MFSSEIVNYFLYYLYQFLRLFFKELSLPSVSYRIGLRSMSIIFFINLKFSSALCISTDFCPAYLGRNLQLSSVQSLSILDLEFISLLQCEDLWKRSSWNPVLWFFKQGLIICKIIRVLQMSEQFKVEVQEHSWEWNQVTAHLQLVTAKPSLRLINLFKYSSSSARSQKDTAIDALIDITDLKSQFKNRVVERSIPLLDLIFICGHFSVQKYKLQASKVFKFLLCDLSLGKIAPFSEGFSHADSLLIQPDDPSAPYHYNVLVKRYAQYQLKYEMSFVVQDDSQLKQAPIFCCLCAQRIAIFYCKDQKKHYCQNCSNYAHPLPDKTKKPSKITPPRHELQAVTRTNSLPLCESHAERHQFYCLSCERYLCQQCTKQNLHNKNEEHPVRPLEYLYTQKHQSNLRLPVKPKQKLLKMLALSQQKLKLIVSNYQEVKKSLERKIKEAMQQLEFMYKQRLVKVQNDLIQLELELQKIDWYSQFVKKQEQILKPIYYFKIQTRYQYEMERIKMNRFGTSYEAQPDLETYCSIQIGTKEQIRTAKETNQTKSSQIAPNRQSQNVSGHNRIDNSKTLAKLVAFNPNSQPVKFGELSLQLQKSGTSFFKIGNQRK